MKLHFKKQTLACVIGGLMVGQAMAATITSAPTVTVTGHVPTLAAGQIVYDDTNANGVLDTGDVVKIDAGNPFVFADADGDTATAETYSWKVDGKEVGTGATYTIDDADLGKTISLDVTPHTDAAITDPADGVSVQATIAGGGTALPIAGGQDVIGVAITGNPVVADTLTATPTCTKACGTVNYQWQVEDAVNSGTYMDIAGATNATYQPTKDDQKKKIQVVVSN